MSTNTETATFIYVDQWKKCKVYWYRMKRSFRNLGRLWVSCPIIWTHTFHRNESFNFMAKDANLQHSSSLWQFIRSKVGRPALPQNGLLRPPHCARSHARSVGGGMIAFFRKRRRDTRNPKEKTSEGGRMSEGTHEPKKLLANALFFSV